MVLQRHSIFYVPIPTDIRLCPVPLTLLTLGSSLDTLGQVLIYLGKSPETYTRLAGVYHGDKHREGKK